MGQRVVVVGPNLPQQAKATFHVHAEGCADLGRGWIKRYAKGERAYEFGSRHDVESFVYEFAPDENEDYTLGDYQFDFHFAPCVTLPLETE